MHPDKKIARTAGFLFLFVVICGMSAEFLIRQKIVVSGDPVTTANNIIANKWLFQLGIVSDLIMSTLYFLYGMFLYFLLKDVNKKHAQVMLLCVVISTAILCTNMINQAAALLLLSGDGYLKVFDASQLNALATFFMKLHTKGYLIAQIFYGLYLFPLGYLVYRSAFIPKAIGILLMLGCVGDLIDVFRVFLFPDYQSIVLQNLTVPATIGEFSFCLWLMIKGVKDKSTPMKEVKE